MITFRMTAPPPSDDQVHAARTALRLVRAKAKTRGFMLQVIATVAVIVSAGSFMLPAEASDIVYYLIASSVCIISVSIGRFSSFLVQSFTCFLGSLYAFVSLEMEGVQSQLDAFAGLTVATFLLLAVAAFSDAAIKKTEARLSLLNPVDAPAYRARCATILDACQKYLECENYRLAVAKQGRGLTVTEGNMLQARAAELDSQSIEENKRRHREEASAMLRSQQMLATVEA